MYKSKLQELCHKRRLDLPVYRTLKSGSDHMLRFTTIVNIQGRTFVTPEEQKSIKEAENTAARTAFEQLNAPPPVAAPPTVIHQVQTASAPILPPQMEMQRVVFMIPPSPPSPSVPRPPPGLLLNRSDTILEHANPEVLQENHADAPTSAARLSMYKNQLQQYAQKNNLGFPEYTTVSHGPPHDFRFKSKVRLDRKIYETPELFSTLKEAEQAAAKVALQALSVAITQEDVGLYKNLLQELAQKKGLVSPSYETVSSGMGHMPIFESVVTIGPNTFRGSEAKSKKQAEVNAAKAAYFALTKVTNSSTVPAVNESHVAGNSSRNIQHSTTTIRRHLDTTNEGSSLRAKRAKA